MILPNQEVQVPEPPEGDALYEIAVEEDGKHGFLVLGGRLDRIRDHVYVVISSGLVPRGSEE